MSEVKLFRLSGSALAIDMRTGHNATLRPGLVVLSEDAHTHAVEALAAECERLREQHEGAESQAEYQRDRAEHFQAERDAALAELAALKGGREAVAMIRYARGVPGFENEMPHVVSCNDLPDGLYPVYLAPPAQASAWVAVSERLPELEQNVLVEFTTIHGTPQHTTATLHRISQHCGPDTPYHNRWFVTVGSGHELHTVTRWQPIAAPTPGASDGKGGEK